MDEIIVYEDIKFIVRLDSKGKVYVYSFKNLHQSFFEEIDKEVKISDYVKVHTWKFDLNKASDKDFANKITDNTLDNKKLFRFFRAHNENNLFPEGPKDMKTFKNSKKFDFWYLIFHKDLFIFIVNEHGMKVGNSFIFKFDETPKWYEAKVFPDSYIENRSDRISILINNNILTYYVSLKNIGNNKDSKSEVNFDNY